MTTSRRRTTLGVLSQSMANSRMSAGLGNRSSLGLSKVGGRTPMGRSSVGGRRSSVYKAGASKMQDPRPIGDKAYQQENIRSLIQFLTSHQYDREVSPKTLSTPARKDFVYILGFLLRHIDANFEFSDAWADDVPVFFEALGYPVRISKRSLLSVGSPHTWPSLLAALVWLADLVTYNEEISIGEENGAGEADNGEKVFYGYLANAYGKFLGGSDNFSFLENDLAEQFQDKNQVVKDDVESAKAESERLKTSIASLQEAKNDVINLAEKRKTYAADIAKFEKLVADLEAYKVNVSEQREAKQKEYDLRQAELESLQKEKAVLAEQLEKQELSAIDVQRMSQERQMLEMNGAKLASEADSLKKRVWDLDMAISKRIDSVEKDVHEYNQMAASIQLIPTTAKYAHGVLYELRLDSGADTVEEMFSVDLKSVVKPALLKLKESFNKMLRSQQVEKRRSNEQVSQSAEMKADRIDQVSRFQARLEKLEKAYKDQRVSMNQELQSIVSKVEDMELELARLQNSQNNALAASESELRQVEKQAEALSTTCVNEQSCLRDEVTSTMEELAKHKVHIGTMLKSLDDLVDSVYQSVC